MDSGSGNSLLEMVLVEYTSVNVEPDISTGMYVFAFSPPFLLIAW